MTEGYEDTVAVIGMTGRFPGARTVEELWDRIVTGRSAVRGLDADELDAVDPARRRHPGFVPVTAPVDDVEWWDAPFFGFTPRAAEITDPQHRLFLECCWEVLETAGYDPTAVPGVAGVLGGCGWPGYLLNNVATHRSLVEQAGHLQLAAGNDREGLVAMAAYKLDLRGPSGTVQTSCSTSMTAVHLACQSLLSFESDVMLAGGAAIGTPQTDGHLYEEGGIVAADGVCRSLDAGSDGGVFGNAVAVLALKRTEDAIADGDRIDAVIRGSAANNDGAARAGYTAPGLRGQAEVMAEALAHAGVSASEVGYVETHGTGTSLGDSIELDAISRTFLPRDDGAGTCRIGSVKPITGHTDRASGAVGLIKSALVLREGRIPAQIHFTSPNPSLDTTGDALRVADRDERWTVPDGRRIALVNSFGLGGANVSVVLEEPPPLPHRDVAEPTPQVLVLSARTRAALDQATVRLRERLERDPDLDLSDVAWTLQSGRTPFNHRRAVVCSRDGLDALDPESPAVERTQRGRPVVVAVPDGLADPDRCRAVAADLHAREPVFAAAFDAARGASRHGEGGATPEAADPTDPRFAAAFGYALGVLLRGLGLVADRYVGHGPGAAVAACLAGEVGPERLGDAAAEDAAGASHLPAGRSAGSEHTADLDDLGAAPVVVELGTGELLAGLDDDAAASRIAAVPADTGRNVREVLAALWLAGADVDWAAGHAGRTPRRVALPTYPFERERYWVDPAPPGESSGSAPEIHRRHEDVSRWFYAPVWRPAPRVIPGGLDARLAEAGPWLLLGGLTTVSEPLADRLRDAGAAVAVAPDDGDGDGYLDPRPRTVLHLGSLSAPRSDGDSFARELAAGFGGAHRLVRALSRQLTADPVRIVLVTTGGTKLDDGERLSPAAAALTGLARVVPQEQPGLACRVVDVDERTTKLPETLLNEALDADPTAVAFRADRRWRQDYEPLNVPTGTGGSPPFVDGGTYLLTGGLGRVCRAIGEHLAERYRARLALLVRSPLPDRDDWEAWLDSHDETDPTSERIRSVRRMEGSGAQVRVVAADVGDAGQVADAVQRVRDELGEPRGVIHGAGVQAEEYFGLLHELDDEVCREHFRPKVDGLAALARALDPDRLDFCVTLSSLACVLGGLGHAPYAAANAAMDAAALELFGTGRRVLSVDWDSWARPEPGGRSAGVTVEAYRMSTEEGIEALTRALGLAGVLPRLVNSTGDLGPRLDAWVAATDDAGPGEGPPQGAAHARPPLASPFVAPDDELEEAVAAVWRRVLGLAEVGAVDDFYELGGHSLLAVQLVGGLRRSLRRNVPIGLLAECRTVRALADRLRSTDAGSPAPENEGGVG